MHVLDGGVSEALGTVLCTCLTTAYCGLKVYWTVFVLDLKISGNSVHRFNRTNFALALTTRIDNSFYTLVVKL